MNRSALYITYDGLLDPLGSSQILPYLYGISRHVRVLHILSFEKSARFAVGAARLRDDLTAQGIVWTPLIFSTRFGIWGKLWDLARMYFWSLYLTGARRLGIVHARGHPAAQVGLFVKRLTGARLIFDFRGLWVDERVDKGGWDMANPFHRLQYRYFKRKERKLLSGTDQLVVLTQTVVKEVIKLGRVAADDITVIPCCADFDHFPLSTLDRRQYARDSCGLPTEALVLGYIGSVGSMYMLDRFFRLFELTARQDPGARALVITQDVEALQTCLDRDLPQALHQRVAIRSANRSEVPILIPAMDILVSFIHPSYARIASSPTKLAECFAQGVPSICNAGVGDIVEQLNLLDAGMIVDANSDAGLQNAVIHFSDIINKGGERLREESRAIFGLEVAEAGYQSVYLKLY